MEHVAYIIETHKGKYKCFVAILNPDGDDSALFPVNSTKRFDTLDEAQKNLDELPKEIKIYKNPIKSNESGLSWLSELEHANK